MKGFIEFLRQTNALALAVGVIIGAAVGKVVSSLVSDVLMPLISVPMPAGDWREARMVLSHKADGSIDKAIGIGPFAGTVVDFLIVAFIVYMITRSLLKPPAPAPAPAVKTCPECLGEIPAAARKCRYCGSAA
jgi:large conductance mechanosensitive channel